MLSAMDAVKRKEQERARATRPGFLGYLNIHTTGGDYVRNVLAIWIFCFH